MIRSPKDTIIERLQKSNAVLQKSNAWLQKENAELKVRLKKLERLVGMNSQNSSKPPSSDPPSVAKKFTSRRRKKRGPKRGHAPHLKQLLPPDLVNHSHVIEPEVCPDCHGEHFVDSGENPLRDQFIDVPPVKIDVTEYVRPVRECTGCSAKVYAPLPENVPASCFGPGVLSLVAVLTGVLNISKRKATMVMNEVFNVPISLGGLSNCEEQIARSLDVSYDQVIKHIREQDVVHADETGWRRRNLSIRMRHASAPIRLELGQVNGRLWAC